MFVYNQSITPSSRASDSKSSPRGQETESGRNSFVYNQSINQSHPATEPTIQNLHHVDRKRNQAGIVLFTINQSINHTQQQSQRFKISTWWTGNGIRPDYF
jgi:hypothetical protein